MGLQRGRSITSSLGVNPKRCPVCNEVLEGEQVLRRVKLATHVEIVLMHEECVGAINDA